MTCCYGISIISDFESSFRNFVLLNFDLGLLHFSTYSNRYQQPIALPNISYTTTKHSAALNMKTFSQIFIEKRAVLDLAEFVDRLERKYCCAEFDQKSYWLMRMESFMKSVQIYDVRYPSDQFLNSCTKWRKGTKVQRCIR